MGWSCSDPPPPSPMAPKRALGNPPPASSASDDDESSEEDITVKLEEEFDELEDDEKDESSVKDTVATPQPSKSEEELGSSTDSDKTLLSPNVFDFIIKPIVHKPLEEIVEPKRPLPEITTPTSKKKLKRPSETPNSLETSKKRNKGSASGGGGDGDGKKVLFQRIWSDEDVIAILEGLIGFKSKKGTDPLTEMADFYESIKDVIHIDVSKNQLSDKIRGLRKKYQNNAKKGRDGEDPVLSKPYDYKTFQLSKIIWGVVDSNGTVADVGEKNSKKSKSCAKAEQSLEEMLAAKVHGSADEFWNSYPSLKKLMEMMPPSLRDLSKYTLGVVRRSKVKELDEKWSKLDKKEFEIHMRSKLFLDMSGAIGFDEGK